MKKYTILFLIALLSLSMLSAFAQDDDYGDDDYGDDYGYGDDGYGDDYGYGDDDYGDDYGSDDYGAAGGDENTLATYQIVDDVTIESADGSEIPADHAELWDVFLLVVPPNYIGEYIVQFDVISSEETAGFVSITEDNPETWLYAMNITELENVPELRRTTIHEFGHVMMLNIAQMEGMDVTSCATLNLTEGCLQTDSYLYHFYEQFWVDIAAAHRAAVGEDGAEDPEAVLQFYEARPNDFINDYAATNYIEDMAETFAEFVMIPIPNSDTLRDQKIRFLYEFPELVELREGIRANLGLQPGERG